MQVHVFETFAVPLHAHPIGGQLGHVDARLERPALTGVHDHTDLWVPIELDPSLGEFVAHQRVHGIELIGTVVDQPSDSPMALDGQALVRRVRHLLLLPVDFLQRDGPISVSSSVRRVLRPLPQPRTTGLRASR